MLGSRPFGETNGGHERAGRRLARVGRERAVAKERIDVVVAGEQPALEDFVVMHGLALAQDVVHRVRIALVGGVERRGGDAGGYGHGLGLRFGLRFGGHGASPSVI